MRNYHQELEAVLTTFRESGPRLKGIILPIGSQGFIRVDIVTCVLFIIQDMQEGDQLCGRYGPHGPSIHRHSRSCNVSFQDLGNWKTKCTYLVASEMHQISQSDQATRTQWSQHQVNNAFNGIVFADPVRGFERQVQQLILDRNIRVLAFWNNDMLQVGKAIKKNEPLFL